MSTPPPIRGVPAVHGYRIGDKVSVELDGRILEVGERDGAPAALVAVGGDAVWVPLERVILRQRADEPPLPPSAR